MAHSIFEIFCVIFEEGVGQMWGWKRGESEWGRGGKTRCAFWYARLESEKRFTTGMVDLSIWISYVVHITG